MGGLAPEGLSNTRGRSCLSQRFMKEWGSTAGVRGGGKQNSELRKLCYKSY
jgi:hypothetical protein